ncbi:MAG: hypothetical protein Roseis2KO_40750 [Roseivirga sp.]
MTQQQFTEYVEQLRNDQENFENKSLDDFLEALGRYAEDIGGYYKNTNQHVDLEKVNWKVFADLLKGASIYE